MITNPVIPINSNEESIAQEAGGRMAYGSFTVMPLLYAGLLEKHGQRIEAMKKYESVGSQAARLRAIQPIRPNLSAQQFPV